MVKTVETGNQVCGIIWSDHYKELISAHNSTREQLIIWKFPSMDVLARLQGHATRTTHMAKSPDGQVIATMGDDDTLKV